MRVLIFLLLLTSCATTTRQHSYQERMRNAKDSDEENFQVQQVDFQIPLIWYVEKF